MWEQDVCKDDKVEIVDLIYKVDCFILGGNPQSTPVLENNKARSMDNDSYPRSFEQADSILKSVEQELGILYNNETDQEFDRHSDDEPDEKYQLIGKCALLRSQLSGIKKDYESLLEASNKAVLIMKQTIALKSDGTESQSQTNWQEKILLASSLGYKGFALVKLGQYSEALPILEECFHLGSEFTKERSPFQSKKEKSKITFADRMERRETVAFHKALAQCYQLTGAEAPPPAVVKFPRTAHLFDTGGSATTPDDLVVSDKDALLSNIREGAPIVIEEKVDGTNLGFSLCPLTGKILVQNRSHYVSSADHAQYNRITEWVAQHQVALATLLASPKGSQLQSRILYGEWLAARHSIPYNKLPGLFVAFDIYDKTTGRFFSRCRFHRAMNGTGIPVVPVITTETMGSSFQGKKQRDAFYATMRSMLDTRSVFRTDGGPVEGIVLRVDEINSDGTAPLWMEHRWKVVRPDFVRGCHDGHWSTRKIEKQQIDYDFSQRYVSDCYFFADKDQIGVLSKSAKETKNNRDESNSGDPAAVENLKIAAKDPLLKNRQKGSSYNKKKEREFQKQLARARRRVPRCVMLMGLPASGKSTFASRLASVGNGDDDMPSSETKNNWTIVNQDSMGRKKCVKVAGKVARSRRIIIDRCNPTEKERSEWREILHNPPQQELSLVYFAADADTCVERAAKRIGHETIPNGRGKRIVEDVSKLLEPPTEIERRHVFGTIEVIHTFDESDMLLRRWGVVDMK